MISHISYIRRSLAKRKNKQQQKVSRENSVNWPHELPFECMRMIILISDSSLGFSFNFSSTRLYLDINLFVLWSCGSKPQKLHGIKKKKISNNFPTRARHTQIWKGNYGCECGLQYSCVGCLCTCTCSCTIMPCSHPSSMLAYVHEWRDISMLCIYKRFLGLEKCWHVSMCAISSSAVRK